MATIGDLVVNLGLNRQGYSRGLQQSRSDLTSFAGGIGGVLKRIALPAIGVLGGALAARESINAARTQIEAENKLQAVLRATGGAAGLTAQQISEYASELQAVTNFGDEATVAAAGVLATFKEIKGDVFKDALAAAQDLSAVMGQDLQSSVVQIGKAMNDPLKGVTALQRVGVSFTEEQKQQIKHLQQAGDLLGAQQIILGELRSEFGGAARGMADPITQAKNVLGDIAEIVGFVLLPPLREVMTAFTGAVGPITSSRAAAEAFGETLAGIVRTGITPIAEGLRTVFEFGAEAADALAFGFRNASDLASLALIDLSLAVFDLIPGTETVAEHVAGTLVALWEASVAAAMSFVDSVIGGLTEIKNFAAAVWEAIRAGLEAILAGGNPLEAITQGFIDTLAAQENATGGGNPLEKFAETFRNTRANIQLGFEEQGLGDQLRDERRRLEESIAAGESAFAARLARDAEARATPLAADDGLPESSAAAGKIGGPRALEEGTRETAEALLKAQLGAQQVRTPEQEAARKQLDEAKKQTGYLKRLAQRESEPAPILEFAS